MPFGIINSPSALVLYLIDPIFIFYLIELIFIISYWPYFYHILLTLFLSYLIDLIFVLYLTDLIFILYLIRLILLQFYADMTCQASDHTFVDILSVILFKWSNSYVTLHPSDLRLMWPYVYDLEICVVMLQYLHQELH